jgi:hypothetical protein
MTHSSTPVGFSARVELSGRGRAVVLFVARQGFQVLHHVVPLRIVQLQRNEGGVVIDRVRSVANRPSW